MNFNTLTAAAALVLAACAGSAQPALAATNANFVGPRVEATAGYADVLRAKDTHVTYGVNGGLDAPLGDRFTVGVQAGVDNVFDRRVLAGGVRVGFAFTPNLLGYGDAGYANLATAKFRNLDGVRYGGGLDYALSKNLYVGAEYRREDFSKNVARNSAFAKVGFRF